MTYKRIAALDDGEEAVIEYPANYHFHEYPTGGTFFHAHTGDHTMSVMGQKDHDHANFPPHYVTADGDFPSVMRPAAMPPVTAGRPRTTTELVEPMTNAKSMCASPRGTSYSECDW